MILTGQKNQCPGCSQYFNSNLAFDMHRTGRHGHDRRCMTTPEMTAKGMSVNAAGFWISESMPINKLNKLRANDESKENQSLDSGRAS